MSAMWLGRSTLFWEPLSGLVSLMVYTPCTHGRLPPPGELAIQRRVQRETLATIGERDAELEDVMGRRLVGIKSARLRRAVGELLGICRGHAGGGLEVEPGAVHSSSVIAITSRFVHTRNNLAGTGSPSSFSGGAIHGSATAGGWFLGSFLSG